MIAPAPSRTPTHQRVLRRLRRLVAKIPRRVYFDRGGTDHRVYCWSDGQTPRYVGISGNRYVFPAREFTHWTTSGRQELDDYFIAHKGDMWLAYAADNITEAVACEIEKSLIKAFGRMGRDKNGLLLNRSRGRSAHALLGRRDRFPLKTGPCVVPHAHLPFKANGRPSREWEVARRGKRGYPDNAIIEIVKLTSPRSPETNEKTSCYRHGMTVDQLKRKRARAKLCSRSSSSVQADLRWDVEKGRIRIRQPRRKTARQVETGIDPAQ